MNNTSEAKKLAYNILLDIEKDKKDLHLLCLQASRLALLLNNQKKSNDFIEHADRVGLLESFINFYGLVIHKLVDKIDLSDIYDFNDPFAQVKLSTG